MQHLASPSIVWTNLTGDQDQSVSLEGGKKSSISTGISRNHGAFVGLESGTSRVAWIALAFAFGILALRALIGLASVWR